jgi:pyruvate carboxylase subunit B
VKYVVAVQGRELEVTLDGSLVRVGDSEVPVHLDGVDGTPIRVVTIGNRVRRVLVRRGTGTGRYTILVDGFRFDVEALDERTRAIRQLAGAAAPPAGPAAIAAPMPGLVIRVLVQEGDRVQTGQPMVVIEAMKMENELRAPAAGQVRTIHVQPGTAVEKGTRLIELEPPA